MGGFIGDASRDFEGIMQGQGSFGQNGAVLTGPFFNAGYRPGFSPAALIQYPGIAIGFRVSRAGVPTAHENRPASISVNKYIAY